MTDGIIRLSRDFELFTSTDQTPIHLMPLTVNSEFIQVGESIDSIMKKLQRRARIKRAHLHYKINEDVVDFILRLRKRDIRGKLYFSSDKRIVYLLLYKVGESYTHYDAMIVARKISPLLIQSIVQDSDILAILDSMQGEYKILIKQILIYGKTFSRVKRKHKETTKRWTEAFYEEVKDNIVAELNSKRLVLESIKFWVNDESGFTALLRISRRGIVSVYDTKPLAFAKVVKILIDELLERATRYYKKFMKVRVIKVEGEELPKVVSGIFIFKQRFYPSEFKTLIDELKKSYYISVNYFGNPWMHLDLIDSEDGSRFSLIVDERYAKIIPDFGSRPSSLQTLVEILNLVAPGSFKVHD